jgi:transcriptional regulator with XRE-family HTH domain
MPTQDDLETIYKHVSHQIQQFRTKHRLSAVDLSREMGIPGLPVTSIEHGNRQPDLAQLCSLADYFQISLDDLVGRTKENKASNSDIFAKLELIFSLLSKQLQVTEELTHVVTDIQEDILQIMSHQTNRP